MKCRLCGDDKPQSDFQIRSDTGKPRTECRACRSASNLSRYHTKPETKQAHHRASRKHYLQKLYGLTVEEYEAMLIERDFRCDICGLPEKQERSLAVDHCHTTGKVRGLLCLWCNTAIGKLRDDPSLIRRAAEYVERHS